MQNHRLTTWLLLGYLAVLLNFGPSAHHADFFGLHDRATTAAGSENATPISCVCCNHHAPANSLQPTEISAELPTTTGDCLFCEYFADFHAVVAAYDFELIKNTACSSLEQRISEHIYFRIASSARGPPCLSHC